LIGFEEVFKMKDMINKNECVNVEHRRVSLRQYVLVILTGIIGLALVYAANLSSGHSNAGYISSFIQSSRVEKATAKQAVLDWMAENSAMPDHVLAKIYNAAAGTHNRDLILAICLIESNFNPHAESDKGAIGLMGIMPGVWLEELKAQGIIREREDLHKISGNIAAGAYVIATYLSETKDLSQALNRYVGGASWYAKKVLHAKRKIELAHGSGQQLAFATVRN
jgi:soluble lytic murein transglycosylase-like protein